MNLVRAARQSHRRRAHQPYQAEQVLCARACARNPSNTPSHGGAAAVTGCPLRRQQPLQTTRRWRPQDRQPKKARAYGTLAPLNGEQAAHGQTAQLSVRAAPAAKTQFLFVRAAIRFEQPPRITAQNWIPEFILYWSLTPELTGAGGPKGPQGTNIGHQNRAAMANVGVRVERFVRLGRVGRVRQVNSKCI
jgi:hypothetical protein